MVGCWSQLFVVVANHLVATALLVRDMKQSPNLRVHAYSFPRVCEISTAFLDINNDDNMKAYIPIMQVLLASSSG